MDEQTNTAGAEPASEMATPTDAEIRTALEAYSDMLFAARRKMQAFLGTEFFEHHSGGFSRLFYGEIDVSVSRHAGAIGDFLRWAVRS